MAKPYNHHQLTYQTCYTNNSFLPLLCRSSSSLAADVKLRDRDLKDQSHVDDPSSPKVSCIGQIKRTTASRRSNSSSTTKTNGNQLINYTKLKRWFSVKNISPATTTTSTAAVYGSRRGAAGGNGGGSCRNGIKRETQTTSSTRWSSKINSDDGDCTGVDISELDPPLPVTKKLSVAAAVEVPTEMSLWRRRRSGAEALTSLTVKPHQIHLPNQPAATV